MMKRISLLLLLTACSWAAFSQADELVPEEAMVVLSVNADRIEDHMDAEKVKKMDWFVGLDQEAKKKLAENYDLVSQIYKSPSKAGVDLFPKSYGFVQRADSLFFMGYVFNMDDQKKFLKFLKEGVMKAGPKTQVMAKKGFSYVMLDEMGVAWNKKYILIGSVQGEQKGLYDGLDYDDDAYYDKLSARREKFRKAKEAMLVSKLAGVVESNVKELEDDNFDQFDKGDYDLGVWVNMGKVSSLIQEQMEGQPGMAQMESMMTSMYSSLNSSYYQGLLNFRDGKADLEVKTYVNEELFDLYKGIYDKKINGDFFDYIDGGKMLGFAAVAIDIEEAAKAALEVYKPMMKEIPQYGAMSGAVLDLMGIALDEEALAGIIEGDMLVAITEVTEKEVTFTDYVYDEDYNMTKVEKTRMQPVPTYVAELTIGNKENFMKLMNAMKSFQLLTEENGMYSVTAPGMEVEVNMMIKGDLMVMSNDKDLIMNGVEKSNRIDSGLLDEVKENGVFVFMDFQHIVDLALKMNENMSEADKSSLTYFKSMFDNMRLTGTQVGDGSFTNTFEISMHDQKENALMQLFKMINHAYLEDAKK